MNKILKAASILSWINLSVWGFVVAMGLISSLAIGNLAMVVILFLLASIVLHSYAALQLQKSIRHPQVPLRSQTATGIRFVGVFALFFGIGPVLNGVTILASARTALQMIKDQLPPLKNMTLTQTYVIGVLALILGLCITLNVILNMRLLRWYQYNQQQQKRDSQNQ